MKMSRLVILIPNTVRSKLNVLRRQGTTAAGLIRHLLEEHFKQPNHGRKGG